MDFISLIFDNLTGTDPRPLVLEVDADEGIRDVDRPTFATLVARVRGGLRARGVGRGDRVVLLGPNGIAWTAIDLAILLEGAISVPLYARQAPTELVGMMIDCAPSLVVVADVDLWDTVTLAWADAPLIDFASLEESNPIAAPPRVRERDEVVTLVYTSGTSGEPKGAMITVANVDHMLRVTTTALTGLMGEDAGSERVFHYLPCPFMGSRIVLWTCLFREVPIYLSTRLDRLLDEITLVSPHYFLNVPVLLDRVREGAEQAIADRGVVARLLYGRAVGAWQRRAAGKAPAWLDAQVLELADERVFDPIRRRFGPDLRFLICGSAALSTATQTWYGMVGVPIYQVYGLTETTAIVTMDVPGHEEAGKVGYAVEGVHTKLTQDGELLVQGPNVFPGYWEKPDATEAAFDDGWFRTGDQAEVDDHGNWRIIGRVKNVLVPSSGHNVTPEPIEQALREAIPGAVDVVLVGHGRPHVAALITGPVSASAIRAGIDAVNGGLPHYKRVRAHHHRAAPLTDTEGLLTANGKLKRAAIEAHFSAAIEQLYR